MFGGGGDGGDAWRTTASNPGPGTRGREHVREPDPVGQAARDRHWQERMHLERLARGVSAEDEANYVGRPEGPAAGVAAALPDSPPTDTSRSEPPIDTSSCSSSEATTLIRAGGKGAYAFLSLRRLRPFEPPLSLNLTVATAGAEQTYMQ
eukprot:SAG22_NODE_6589_length_835_cov_0.891304_1_plen_150_part_00